MARMEGKIRREFDAEVAVTLRDAADGAETAAVAEAGVDINALTKAYWDDGEIPHGVFLVNIHVPTVTTDDETYTLDVEVDTTSGFASPVKVATVSPVGKSYMTVPIESASVEALLSGASWLRLNLSAVSGTAPSIVYGGWLTYLKA